MADSVRVDDGSATRDTRGEWVPRILRTRAALFAWPPRPKAALKFLFGFPGFLWPFGLAFNGAIAAFTWFYLQPGASDISNFSTLRADWIVLMYLRNAALLLVVAGGWHLRLYWARAQGTRFKYNSRWPSTNSKAFLFGNQVRDNMFWSLVSGAGIWTIYEALMLWAYGNGWLPFAELRTNPVWFVVLLVLLAPWSDLHFYWVHRISHWKPLYRACHYLHHRNVNVGPWSGLSMHPLEHVLYFSRWIILFLVPSHPIHMLYLMQRAGINPAVGHTGFDEVVINKERDTRMSIDSFFHYLHHRYFECNYGSGRIPLDRWFGTFHDGSEAAHAAMRRKRATPAEVVTGQGAP